jgi:hypothetical protein
MPTRKLQSVLIETEWLVDSAGITFQFVTSLSNIIDGWPVVVHDLGLFICL